jgi:cell division protein FtsB
MVDVNSTANLPCIIMHPPKGPTEINWVEGAHGVESIVTIFGLAIGAWWAYRNDWLKSSKDREDDRELRRKEQDQRQDTLDQRNRQLRWDQAKLAKEINDQFLEDHEAQEALGIIDSDASFFEITDDTKKPPIKFRVLLDNDEHIKALQINPKAATSMEAFVRECFDAWFYWMSIMEQYLKNELIREEDIAYPSDYYIRCLRDDRKLYDACVAYIERYRLSPNILKFMVRFTETTRASISSSAAGKIAP